jgi:hypothetical protein
MVVTINANETHSTIQKLNAFDPRGELDNWGEWSHAANKQSAIRSKLHR